MSPSSQSALSSHSNLECFLDCTTPFVPSQILPKTCIRDLNSLWHPIDDQRETMEYFNLGDLWDRYDEWSAYGAGAPIVLSSGETVVQYYVPYLSAIQIYTSKSFANLRPLREDSDQGEFEGRDSSSDSWSDDSESDKALSRWPSYSSPGRGGAWDATSEDSSFDQEGGGLWPMRDRLGYLYFQYFERSAPYGRIPLMDKINELSTGFPGLMSLKSIDLSPASWMAVAWYPIYHIPTGRTVKDLSACFLTYHTLSSSFQENGCEDGEEKVRGRKGNIALPPFGLATYKMMGSNNLWMNGSGESSSRDQDRIISLMSAADSWLKQLRVQHHDFNYFVSHSNFIM
ncbi:uncharacterized protein LOC18438379 [Amborella trichopoda]|uniref:DUF789 domain-containing protein n=1 Tax=Amborella trichopoda TaxID=13333 RepID=W1PJR4_AMBTC|nr:uncharacterized protein LOC18438379 [Amborella trichopoda]ERN10207.1 hypothetical protein AMTR_s00171p00039640 [Amborella trichopoda]|eukprot:XP_006848626.1 uncharacterized protein LOC18438379 [Amborella trichopoda]